MSATKLPNPIRCASGYSLDLYCDHLSEKHGFMEFPHQFFGEHGPQVFREARAAGWIIHRDRTATCPKCARKK